MTQFVQVDLKLTIVRHQSDFVDIRVTAAQTVRRGKNRKDNVA